MRRMELSLPELRDFAATVVRELPQKRGVRAHVIGLTGDLGSGKTAFVQEVARTLGVTATVSSPTFTLIRTYALSHPAFKQLVHIDAYRLTSGEKDTVGFAEYMNDPQNLVFVEWCENLPQNLIAGAPIIEFSHVDSDLRHVSYAKK